VKSKNCNKKYLVQLYIVQIISIERIYEVEKFKTIFFPTHRCVKYLNCSYTVGSHINPHWSLVLYVYKGITFVIFLLRILVNLVCFCCRKMKKRFIYGSPDIT